MKIQSALLVFAAAALVSDAIAADFDIALGKSVFGLSMNATEQDFRRVLGEPAAVVKMRDERHGLLYGQNVLLIFSHGTLRQARAWMMREWSSELYHGWLQYVPLPANGMTGFTVNKNIALGESRERIEDLLDEADVDGDEYSTVAQLPQAQVWLGYEYEQDANTEGRDVKNQTLVSLVVEFKVPDSRTPR